MIKLLKLIFKYSVIFAAWVSVAVMAVIFYYYTDLPSITELESSRSKQIIQINYSDGSKLTTLGDLYDNRVAYEEIPKHLIDAVIATEDRRFFTHGGIDIYGIMRASYVNYKAGKVVQGGSTITQQLTKLLFLKPERTFKRKIQEVLLAIKMEKNFTKEQILTLYLNRVYLGAGNYGVASASKYYFNKSVSKINLRESALLAGLLKAPSRLSPVNNKKLAKGRTDQVLNNMIDAGYLGENNAEELKKSIAYNYDHQQRFYFSSFVADQFWGYLSKEDKENHHFNIITTLDKKIQSSTEDAVGRFVTQNKNKLGKAQLAVLVMSRDGKILSMIGGKDYQKSPFNRALYSKRQPGSAFKTFIYLTAFQQGFKPDDLIEDKKVNVGSWEPENSDKKYRGQVSLKTAFAMSLNSVAVQLSGMVNRKQVIENAEKMGIISDIDKNDPTIALGTMQVSLLELVASYATIANDGYAVIPYSVEEITNENDDTLYSRESSGLGKVISSEEVGMLKEILREVVENGTGKNANIADDIYGKTGTSQNFRDAWFIGFDDNYVIGVWIGNDNNSPTDKITGGSLPAFLFSDIMRKIG